VFSVVQLAVSERENVEQAAQSAPDNEILCLIFRRWRNFAAHRRELWANPPKENSLQRVLTGVAAELERLSW